MNQTTDLFSSRVTPWHTIGTAVRNATDSATAIKLAALDWEVHQAPVRYFDGKQGRVCDSLKVNYRSDTGNVLGVVTKRYASSERLFLKLVKQFQHSKRISRFEILAYCESPPDSLREDVEERRLDLEQKAVEQDRDFPSESVCNKNAQRTKTVL